MKKTLLNMAYNALYQVFLVIMPFLTVPYLSRVLGPSKLGIYSYVNFTMQFLMVFCACAMGQIGTRTVARYFQKHDETGINQSFWGLWKFQLTVSVIVISLLVAYLLIFNPKYTFYFFLLIPFLISAMIDISWFFQGIEDFGRVVLRNTTIKILTVALIFLLVRRPSQLWLYCVIMSGGILIGNLVFWISIKNYVGKPYLKFYRFSATLRTIIILIIPQVATQVYTSLDKTILGSFTSTRNLSFYDQSQKISFIILGVITSISIVIMPKMATLDKKAQQKLLKYSFESTLLLGILFSVVVMCNTKQFVPWFFGSQYTPMIPMMFLVSLNIIFIPVGGVFANQFALSIDKDVYFAVPVVIGAIISLFLNFSFDGPYGAMGATVNIVVVEIIVCLLRIWIVRKHYKAKYIFSNLLKMVFIGIIIFTIGMLMPNFIPNVFFNMAAKSITIGLIFLILLHFFKIELYETVVNTIKKRIHRLTTN